MHKKSFVVMPLLQEPNGLNVRPHKIGHQAV